METKESARLAPTSALLPVVSLETGAVYKSFGVKPVCFAILASIFGPISTRS